MKITRFLKGLCVMGSTLLVSGLAQSADNCTGYDSLVAIYAETLDLGGGHTLTAFRQASIITSDSPRYNLTTGECSGAALSTPDGKVRVNGYCARRDKDGDTQSIEFSQAAGAEKGVWKSTGGTGKFAGKSDSGWFEDVRTDGKMSIAKWGGNCK
jgi:hypothetical protein